MKTGDDQLALRKATSADSQFILDLRNDLSARKFFFDSSPIDLSTHKKWFRAKLNDPKSELFVIISNKEKAGQVRINIEGNLP